MDNLKVGVEMGEDAPSDSEKLKVCFLSSFPPRKCGIATFTQDLITAMDKKFNPKLKAKVMSLNEDGKNYQYDGRVITHINCDDIDDYLKKAEEINQSEKIKLVNIQHEFGLHGGSYGDYLIPFMDKIEKPIAVTFHSVLPDPDEKRKRIVRSIDEKCLAIIVMAQKAIEILNKDYGINREKIHLVRHGIPNVPFEPDKKRKKKMGLEGKTVLSTFGLLSKDKGIEYAIRALPPLVEKYPNLVYLVIGQTHPKVKEQEGEKYRDKLKKEIKELGLEDNVKFINHYVGLGELTDYLLATDIYLFTNLEKEQITSGTLSYVVGCGKAVVSTPVLYAKELLAGERGIIVGLKKPKSFTQAIDKLLSNPEMHKEMEKKAYYFGRKMVWSNVATRYLNVFNQVVHLRDETTDKFPPVKMSHLKTLTNDFGVIQFSEKSVPDKETGYTVDDNARALIASVLHYKLFGLKSSLKLSNIYLDFLEHTQMKNGNFKNNLYNENETLDTYSEDAFGRALWALGYTVQNGKDKQVRQKAKELFEKSICYLDSLDYLRSKAFSLSGLCYYYKKYQNKRILEKIKTIADDLVRTYENTASEDWKWFENKLTYSNSKLVEPLFMVYELTGKRKYLKVAEEALEFLAGVVFIDGKFVPIGHRGWFKRGGERAIFGQQPIEASTMTQTYITAYRITGNKKYYNRATQCFNWFLGSNYLNQMVYDEITGGCFDGLSKDSINMNQGAESTICYLIARMVIGKAKRGHH